MKAIVNRLFMSATLAALVVCLAVTASAQTGAGEPGRVRLDSLEQLRARAVEHVIVDIDASLLKFATSMLSGDKPDEKEVRQIAEGLRGVFVRIYEFKAEGQYAEADVTAIRTQLRAPGWSRMVDIKSGESGSETLEVYLATTAGRVEGLALLGAGPKKVMVVNLVGSVDLEKLRKLEGSFGIPKIKNETKSNRPDTNKNR